MARLKVFVSFEYDKDKQLKGAFTAQAKNRSPHTIKDSSLREAYPTQEWQQKARKAIEGCDVVIVLVGEDTHNAPGVKTELRFARKLKKPIIQIVPQRSTRMGFENLDEPIRWKWTRINAELDKTANS